nr:hypothetical protein [uncultured Erythrobacter sp.]
MASETCPTRTERRDTTKAFASRRLHVSSGITGAGLDVPNA